MHLAKLMEKNSGNEVEFYIKWRLFSFTELLKFFTVDKVIGNFHQSNTLEDISV